MNHRIIFVSLGIIASVAFVIINGRNDSFYQRKMNGVWWLQMLFGIIGMQGITDGLVLVYNYYGMTSEYLRYPTLLVVMLILSVLGERATKRKKNVKILV